MRIFAHLDSEEGGRDQDTKRKPNRKEADQLEKEIAEKMSDIERASLITCEQDKVKKILQIEAIRKCHLALGPTFI